MVKKQPFTVDQDADIYGIIMAGGSGTRFWPRSREEKSKQFLTISGKKSLIQNTLKRFQSLVGWKNIFIVSKINQKKILEKHILKVPLKNIIYEPMSKNTAACIGLAAVYVQQMNQNNVMVVSPADHQIQKESCFQKTIRAAVKIAKERDVLVTIGIPPDRPATGFGYIQIEGKEQIVESVEAYQVKTFAEKPNLETAQAFIQSGDFFWNSGIFIFRSAVYLEAVEEFLPDLYDGLMKIKKSMNSSNFHEIVQTVYRQIGNLSIDYGVMENAKNVVMVKGNFVWDDLGSWEQFYKSSPKDENGNAVAGNVILVDTKNSFLHVSRGVIAVIGLDDMVVVQEGGATLICKRDRVEDVKQVVDRLKRKKLNKYV